MFSSWSHHQLASYLFNYIIGLFTLVHIPWLPTRYNKKGLVDTKVLWPKSIKGESILRANSDKAMVEHNSSNNASINNITFGFSLFYRKC